jgi:hypothetical protein
MSTVDRRQYPRFALNYPVQMQLAGHPVHFSVRILDAGIDGMRLELSDSEQLRVGQQLDITCKSFGLSSSANGVIVDFQCRVIWEDEHRRQFGIALL